ncbi:hypothetical protein MAR_025051 [Mya arenaria]|uniref:Secreted protein n=1 Tax=Mya arenaria TaxID=6604 RepID=A0ABY7DX41_MYAAR|nr:hypothetical protein MAR_025051 [Mya arenaria]
MVAMWRMWMAHALAGVRRDWTQVATARHCSRKITTVGRCWTWTIPRTRSPSLLLTSSAKTNQKPATGLSRVRRVPGY